MVFKWTLNSSYALVELTLSYRFNLQPQITGITTKSESVTPELVNTLDSLQVSHALTGRAQVLMELVTSVSGRSSYPFSFFINIHKITKINSVTAFLFSLQTDRLF